ncbi:MULTISPECIES: MFS transporter [Paraburkholderia]|uniref:MFS transporter n=1 Tax=Paraburkholderia TaxID=1822464 RepID=UPI0022546BA0|nr:MULTISPECIES: MFS transporter [Paraburkholderia]MCX4176973.1 MFS transporter [Paraburkholderia madseniana]MDQ6464963.1 MFS transporter [Paraburkholderia madseniana]
MRLDLRKTIDESPMTRFQNIVVTVCILLNMLDGFDVLSMAFTAAHISAEWNLNGTKIGLLLSAGLFGMGAGSLFIAPLADRLGRRTIILVCLMTIAGGMLASSMAQSVAQLAILRAVTGLGIGGMLASLTVITSEYSSDRWRSGAISMQSTGYALGATIGGIIAGILLSHAGWRSVFASGGLATAAMLPVVFALMPESLDYITAKRPTGALEKINKILARMGHVPVNVLPLIGDRLEDLRDTETSSTAASLFHPALLVRTLTIWASFFLVMASFYFVMSWTPKLLVQSGMSASQGITGAVLLNVGGIFGCTLFSALSSRLKLRTLLYTYLLVGVVALVAFGNGTHSLQVSMLLAVLIGAAISGCVGGLYSLAPMLYPTESRATGMGWAIGMGRIGAILAPMSVGALIDAGWKVGHLYFLFAVPLLAAVASIAIIYASVGGRAIGRSSSATA